MCSVESRAAAYNAIRGERCDSLDEMDLVDDAVELGRPHTGWSNISIPSKQTLISDAGKLAYLDGLLTRLKAQNHRVLIYSQMTRVIDLLEVRVRWSFSQVACEYIVYSTFSRYLQEYMWHRKHRYMRLDGSSKIAARRDMVADFQSREDIFVFLLSTRAGGLGINLTAADTVSTPHT